MAFSGDASAAAVSTPGPDVLLRRLTASLAHNVNNALTGVIGYLELALAHPAAPAEVGACVRPALACAHQAADAVRRIVACTRLIAEAGTSAPHSLRRLAEQAADRWASASAQLRPTPVGSCGGPVLARAELVGTALDALLRAMAPSAGGTLTLRVAEENGQGVLYVASDAIGGPDLPLRLLEASLLIEIQGGAVEVLSAPGRAAAIRLSLPRRCETPFRRDDAQTVPPAPHLPATLGLLRKAV